MNKNAWKHTRMGKQYHFSASHQLLNTGIANHPCARLHGHNYIVEVECRGDVSPKQGWIMDFAYLDQSIAPLIDQLDHRHLNDIIDNPTCENVAQWIMDSHKPHIAWSVKVWETPKCWAMAMNPDGFWRAKDRGE